ncbi:MAG TPA: peptide chain release factor-like protein [Tepidisphaeraceae bacterium]|jgi:hypothetical protein
MTWRDYLLLPPQTFEAQCRTEGFRGTGPGGQKRNKTSSAVRIVHVPSGIAIRAEEERSQSSNRKAGLDRLRWQLALTLRGPVDPPLVQGETDPEALIPPPPGTPLRMLNFREEIHVAIVLDVLHAVAYSVRDAAEVLAATTGGLAKFICANELMLIEVNRQRALFGIKPLRPR